MKTKTEEYEGQLYYEAELEAMNQELKHFQKFDSNGKFTIERIKRGHFKSMVVNDINVDGEYTIITRHYQYDLVSAKFKVNNYLESPVIHDLYKGNGKLKSSTQYFFEE